MYVCRVLFLSSCGVSFRDFCGLAFLSDIWILGCGCMCGSA